MTAHLNAGFGVEIECFLPEGATQNDAARAVSGRLGQPVQTETYNHQLRNHWKVVTDGSLGDFTRGIEFVSPILCGTEGLDQVEKVCKALTDFGCTVSKKCGLHVHVGVGNENLDFFKNIVKLYATYEPVLDSIMPPSRRASNNMFCRSMTAARPSSVDRCTSIEMIISTVSGSAGHESRYFKLNLAAYRRHKTVEFRQHSGTLDASKARNWTVLCLRMVAAARKGIAIGSAPTTSNRARPNSKAFQVGQMLLRPEGATGREVCAALGWPSVSMPQQAGICGLEFTTQRTGREVRYFARGAAEARVQTPITVEGFATLIEADESEQAYLRQRATDLSGAIAWAA